MVFLGSDRWSVPSLEALAASPHELALVATRAPKPAGRGSKLTPTPVGEHARLAGLAWDLGAAYVHLPPQPHERLPGIVAGLMGIPFVEVME